MIYYTLSFYYLIGWVVPVPMTIAWAVVTGTHYDSACWYGYNHKDYYYIVEGPRLAVIAVWNFLCNQYHFPVLRRLNLSLSPVYFKICGESIFFHKPPIEFVAL